MVTFMWIHSYGYIHGYVCMDTFIGMHSYGYTFVSFIQLLFKYAFNASLKTIHWNMDTFIWIHSYGYIHIIHDVHL